MNKKFTAYLILICALGLTITAGYYSVVGLTIIFSGTFLPVLIFGSFLELSKVGITTYLHSYWSKIKWSIKSYLITVIIILSLITSLGIYGLLSSGFKSSILQSELNQTKIEMIDSTVVNNKKEINQLTYNYSLLVDNEQKLRQALIDKTTLQSYNNKGQLITKSNSGSRKSFDIQLQNIKNNKVEIQSQINTLQHKNDSLDAVRFNIVLKDKSSTELTSLQNLSEFTGYSLKTIANIFIFILIFVFDPLAIILILSSNQAFKFLNTDPQTDNYAEYLDSIKQEITLPENTSEESIEKPLTSTPNYTVKLEEVFKLLDGKSSHEKINIIDYIMNNYYLSEEDKNILYQERTSLLKKVNNGD